MNFYADTTRLQTRHPDPRLLGQTLKDDILRTTGLTCTVALASGKTVAKIAADAHKPDGLAVIEQGMKPPSWPRCRFVRCRAWVPNPTEAVERLG